MKKSNIIFLVFLAILALIVLVPAKRILEEKPPVPAVKIPPPELEANAALAVDFLNGATLYAKNETKPLPLASLTKIISALVILDLAKEDEEVLISPHAIATEGQSTLIAGEHLTVRDLLVMVMRESSNDAMEALVEHVAQKNNVAPEDADIWFLPSMEQKALLWKLNDMVFLDPTGLDVNRTIAGAYGSARDILRIAQYSYNSELWQLGKIESVTSKEGTVHMVNPTNLLDGALPQLIGAKTGFTDIAGGNLLVLMEYPIGHPLGIVVLGSSEQGRFEDVKKLLDWIKSASS